MRPNEFAVLMRDDLKAVLVHLLGGLGNQMFQYAAARAVARSLASTLFSCRRARENFS